LLESANFERVANRRTSRALKLPSEASRRFEKGLPEDLTMPSGLRATQLIAELSGGNVAKGAVDAYPVKQQPIDITLTAKEVERLLGATFTVDELEGILRPLGFVTEVAKRLDNALDVRVPMHRTDVTLPADLVEEVARTVGYDNLPTTMLGGKLPAGYVNESLRWEELARNVMVGSGFTEIITYSFASRERLRRLTSDEAAVATLLRSDDPIVKAVNSRISVLGRPPLLVVNPLTTEWECLRTTTLVSMLETIRSNLRFIDRDVDLFEIGRIYLPRGEELPEERRILTAGMSQYRSAGDWGKREEVSFFDLKAAAEAVLQRMGIQAYHFVPAEHPTFQSGRTSAVVLNIDAKTFASHGIKAVMEDKVVGIIGEVARGVRANFDLDERVYAMALDLESLVKIAVWDREYRLIPKFPPVEQDIAVVVDSEVPAELVREVIRSAGTDLVRRVQLFDVYQGPGIPEGKLSLAYHIIYQASDRTLTDQEVNQVHGQIEGALKKQLRATLRS
jgi:phenylalanyl-tRNA synthetase beta chain